jgi:hypothetical protein
MGLGRLFGCTGNRGFIVLLGMVLLVGGIFLVIYGLYLNRKNADENSTKTTGPAGISFDVPVSLFVVVLGLLTVAGSVYVFQVSGSSAHGANTQTSPSSRPPSTTRPSTEPTSSTAPPALPSVIIVSPSEDAAVSQKRGVTLVGTVSGLDSQHTIWLFDLQDGDYTLDQSAVIDGNDWSATSAPLGDSGDTLPFSMVEVVAVGNEHCSNILEPKLNGNSDIGLTLPSGCLRVGELHIIVTRR